MEVPVPNISVSTVYEINKKEALG